MLFYCEKSYSSQKKSMASGVLFRDVVLDSAKKTDLSKALTSVGLGEMNVDGDRRSMLRIRALACKKFGYPREGSWYNLGKSFWSKLRPDSGEGNSHIIRASLEPISHDIHNFPTYRHNPPRTPTGFDESICETPTSYIEVDPVVCPIVWVMGVGQANWNEVRAGNRRIMYDLGVDDGWSDQVVRRHIDAMLLAPFDDQVIILSHWDTDHYSALFHFTQQELATFRFLVAPWPVPPTLTAQRVFSSIRNSGLPYRLLDPAPQTGRRIGLHLQSRSANTDIFRAGPGVSRNQTGIVLVFKWRDRLALLCGDHHYNKLLDDVLQAHYPNHEVGLVVPHHGGRAGVIDEMSWSTRQVACALSYGLGNLHGHPSQPVLSSLRRAGITPRHTRGTTHLMLDMGRTHIDFIASIP
ncbi:MAG: hypothetical protein KGZ53_04545 [Peptococcaceae bacterium]|nr:hypothetical protein [Peptococcaceae bacterium]